MAKDKPTIELKNVDDLVPILEKIHKAVADGELDAVLMVAKKDREKSFVRGSIQIALRYFRRIGSLVEFVPQLP